jgi:hypothetical protein
MRNMWRRTPQRGLWIMGGALNECRLYSRFLALQLKADLEGILPAERGTGSRPSASDRSRRLVRSQLPIRRAPIADHDDAPGSQQVELQRAVVGVAVVPGDELGRRVRSRQILAGNPDPPVGRGPDRVDDNVAVLDEICTLHVRAELDAAEEPNAFVPRRLLERARDGLDVGMNCS